MEAIMKVLFLLVNSTCDINCTNCFYTTGHEKRSRFRVQPEISGRVAERIASVGFNTVILSGGDPLHSRFKYETYVLISELKACGLKVIINTSAVRLTEEDLDTIIGLGVDRVDISIDSHDAGINNALRGRHHDTVSAITGLIERGYRNVVTTTVVAKLNAPTLMETISWLKGLGVEDVRIQRVFLPNDSTDDGGTIMQAMRDVEPSLRASHASRYIELTERAFNGQSASCGARCRMGKEYFVCNAQGTLTPCFHREDVVLGNLFEDPLDAVLQALVSNELTAHDVPPCFGGHCASLFDIPNFWRERP
jgi:MoaA/NifB/PqqE/SkfB family radical SAM enzyme